MPQAAPPAQEVAAPAPSTYMAGGQFFGDRFAAQAHLDQINASLAAEGLGRHPGGIMEIAPEHMPNVGSPGDTLPPGFDVNSWFSGGTGYA